MKQISYNNYEKANEILIEMFNKEVEALKNEINEYEQREEYEIKHKEIYTRYNIIWAALK